MTNPCNNYSSCHSPAVIGEDENALRVVCDICKHQYRIGKQDGSPENRLYSEIYRRDTLQPSQNLFYKYNPQYMELV